MEGGGGKIDGSPRFDPAPTVGPTCCWETSPASALTFTGITSQGKQFRKQAVLLQEPPFSKCGPL